MAIRSAWFFGVWLCCSLIMVPVSQAEPVIRVALSQDAVQLRIIADRFLRVRWSSGRHSTLDSSVMIRWSSEGIAINERIYREAWGQFPSRDSGLTVELVDTRRDHRLRSWEVSGSVVIHHRERALLVVNHVPLEQYVAGVVAGEIDPTWHSEALKAQAIAARTYVLYKAIQESEHAFDVVASVQDQVYHGRRSINGNVTRAVAATKGIVITYEQRPIYAAYSSTAAGLTEDAYYVWELDLPYLKGVDCPFDEASPRYRWETAVPIETLEHRLRQAGYRIGIVATVTPFSFTPSGRVDRVRILHSEGELIVSGQDLRRAVGYSTIFSTQFTVTRLDRALVLHGKGAGHGVGLCQWGMKEMAELGYRHQAILRYYYPGTQLLPLHRVRLALSD
ncbi:MAG: SpoIID/LytB domain-containing protein [Nitrospirae bacterium]|nr:MAG: SpoIID/LytB domain-containing protein [Nitrospirota bacterium]